MRIGRHRARAPSSVPFYVRRSPRVSISSVTGERSGWPGGSPLRRTTAAPVGTPSPPAPGIPRGGRPAPTRASPPAAQRPAHARPTRVGSRPDARASRRAGASLLPEEGLEALPQAEAGPAGGPERGERARGRLEVAPGAAAPLRPRVAHAGGEQALLLEPVEGGVERPTRDSAMRPPPDLLPDGDGVGLVLQS